MNNKYKVAILILAVIHGIAVAIMVHHILLALFLKGWVIQTLAALVVYIISEKIAKEIILEPREIETETE